MSFAYWKRSLKQLMSISPIIQTTIDMVFENFCWATQKGLFCIYFLSKLWRKKADHNIQTYLIYNTKIIDKQEDKK